MYLVDTNVWLERLLDQTRSAEVGQFLGAIASDELLMSDFTLHSIGSFWTDSVSAVLSRNLLTTCLWMVMSHWCLFHPKLWDTWSHRWISSTSISTMLTNT